MKCPLAQTVAAQYELQGGSRLDFYLTRYNTSHVLYLDSSMVGVRCSNLQIGQLVNVE